MYKIIFKYFQTNIKIHICEIKMMIYVFKNKIDNPL